MVIVYEAPEDATDFSSELTTLRAQVQTQPQAPSLTITHPTIIYELLPASSNKDNLQAEQPASLAEPQVSTSHQTTTSLNQALVDILNQMDCTPIETPPKILV